MNRKTTRNQLVGIVAACSVLLWSTAVFAFSDGPLGLTSAGTTIVSITKGDVAQITGMGDIALPPWIAGAVAGATTSCVYTTTGAYQVTASSGFTSGVDFRLSDS